MFYCTGECLCLLTQSRISGKQCWPLSEFQNLVSYLQQPVSALKRQYSCDWVAHALFVTAMQALHAGGRLWAYHIWRCPYVSPLSVDREQCVVRVIPW